MKRAPRRGFTLLEIMITLFIVSAFGISFFYALSATRRGAAFTAEHFSAIILGQDVVEHLTTEISLDPSGFETLGIEGAKGNPVRIVDGSSVFFSHLEDRAAPWYYIDPRTDGKLDAKMAPLYNQVKDFEIDVMATRVAPPADTTENRNLFEAAVRLQWKPAAGRGVFAEPCRFASPVTPKQVTPLPGPDAAALDAFIVQAFYLGGGGQTLTALLASKGGDPETIRAFGRVYYMSQQMLQSAEFLKLKSEIAMLERVRAQNEATPGPLLASCCQDLGRKQYEVAKAAFMVMDALAGTLEKAIPNFDQAHLGTELWQSRALVLLGMQFFKGVCQEFNGGLENAKLNFERLLDPRLAREYGGKWRLQNLQRLFDLHRILCMYPRFPDARMNYRAFLAAVEKEFKGRNPFLDRFAMKETSLVGDEARMLARYPTLVRLKTVLTDRLPVIRKFTQDQEMAVGRSAQ